jgi:hypothetical protein
MKHLLIILISLLLLPITVFGWEWTVKYDMKKSDGSYEFVELSVPLVEGGFWELPNQGGDWICRFHRSDSYSHTSGSLHCRPREDKPQSSFTSMIGCDREFTENNKLGINYPSDTKGVSPTVIILKCGL